MIDEQALRGRARGRTRTRRWRCWPTSPGRPTRSCASWPGAWPPSCSSTSPSAARSSPRGVGQLRTQRYRPDGGDLDVDASLDAVVAARVGERAVDPDDLRVRAWSKPGTAICLLVDRSGSMGGEPLATAAVAASAVSWRAPEDYSVLSFGKDVIVAKSQDVAEVERGGDRLGARAARASAPPTSPARCGPPASSSRGRGPGARSRCCCRTVGPPCPATWSRRRRGSTNS